MKNTVKSIILSAIFVCACVSQMQAQEDRYEPEMVFVQGGTFTMGCTYEQGCYGDDNPAHQVTLSSYYIGKYEVTQKQWQEVMGTSLRQQGDKVYTGIAIWGEGDNYPMYYVSWEEIVGTSNSSVGYILNGITYYTNGFCYKLSQLTGSGKQYRLPTEAEWEYAAKGGSQSRGYKYSGSNTAGDVAWYSGNSEAHPEEEQTTEEELYYGVRRESQRRSTRKN